MAATINQMGGATMNHKEKGRLALGALFLISGASKFFSGGPAIEQFERWGFPEGLRQTVGALELVSGLALAVPVTAGLGALGLIGLMIGAAITHLRTPGEV